MNMEWNTGNPPESGYYLSCGTYCSIGVRYYQADGPWRTTSHSTESWLGMTHWMHLPNKPVAKPTPEELLKQVTSLAIEIKNTRTLNAGHWPPQYDLILGANAKAEKIVSLLLENA